MPISPANPRVVEAYTYGYMRALLKRAYGYHSQGWA
jgi:hypothetical protein